VSAEDRDLFLSAVADARPLGEADRDRIAPPPPPGTTRIDEPPPTIALHVDRGAELIRARRPGVSHAQVAELAAGRVRAEAELDLHGHTVADAEAALRRFLVEAARSRRRCVLVIHGYGRRTAREPGGDAPLAPVRDAVIAQLVGPLSGLVHALATAPPKAGGPGATYVMVKP
jgi:DNA-nicking Smr family endonuclease